ncbi:zinc finger protein 723-like [Danaus plexippus]|uniref:zinc finger protein 723-like n=1 Tax=Danaus plexippus TaxID=13037 RepID=UPI002AB0AF62|nr:zinc finger protein 723-like [Danaus plexippus]
MYEEMNLKIVIANILNEKRYSHCRLCFKNLTEQYVRFDDAVSLHPESGVFQPLSEILLKLLGDNICDEIKGVEAVCTDCVENALLSARFVEKCQHSTKALNEVFNNISNTLDVDIDNKDNNKTLYVVIEDLESKLLVVKKTDERNSLQGTFECEVCTDSFDTFTDLKVHNLTNHGTLTCDKCYDTFDSNTEFSLHESQHHVYKCPECPQYRNTEESLEDHQNRLHNVFVCKECGKRCRGLYKLQVHEEKHKTKNSCPKCGKSYTTKEFFDRHVNLCINNLIDPHPIRSSMVKSYSCEKCDKAYSTAGGLRVHNRFAHGNAKPHECKECGKQFTAPSYLKVHMIKHTGEKNFKCDICHSKFVSKEALLYHTRRHTGEKPYSCKYCNERFVNASTRAEHIKFKHVGPTLMCEICSRKFVTSHFLKQHINRHHDPTSKLYYGRNMIPPNLPLQQNMKKVVIHN